MEQTQKSPFIELDTELFSGYISELEDGCIISHISTKNRGEGHFSRLLNKLKKRYNWIKIPTPSKQMFDIVSRKGFILRKEFFPEPFNCVGDIMYWKK